MPTKLGEYCIRCGAKCEIQPSPTGINNVYVCPNGHGIQGIASPATPSETGLLNMAMNDTTDDIVALENASTTAIAGAYLVIDDETMEVLDATDSSNLKVARGANDSTPAAHTIGAQVNIYGG